MHRSILIVALAALPALCNLAIADGGDIAITRINNRIVTGSGDHGAYPNVYEFPERVFAADLEEFGGLIFTDEPGWMGPFDNVGQGFMPGTALGFNIRKAVRRWTGDDFLAGPAAEQMRLFDSGPGTNQVVTPLLDEIVPGFAVVADAAVHGLGGFDEHPFYQLTTNTDGIYLLELEIWASDPLIQTSEPLWIVFNWNMPEIEHDRAIEWVETFLVPAPGTLALLAGAAALGVRRRR